MVKLLKGLYVQVILAIFVGITVGFFFPAAAVTLKPLGDGFIKLVKMMIAPVIFCTIVNGIAGMRNAKKVGRIGIKTLIYFEVVSTLALIIGLIIVNILKPGAGMNIDTTTLDAQSVSNLVSQSQTTTAVEFALHIIPENIINALSNGNLLQILFFSVLFGIALSSIGEKAEPVVNVIKSLEAGLFAIIQIIMKIAPVGAFGAMAFTIGKYGVGSLASLGQLMISFYLTCAFFIIVVLGGILRYFGYSLIRFLQYIKEELLIVLGTSSSESALPSLMRKMETVGCSDSVVGLVIPTGYSFNLDGTSIYLTMAVVFLSQAINVPMDISSQILTCPQMLCQ